MTEKTGFKYSVKASQSLTTGTVGFEATIYFDDPEELKGRVNELKLVELFENQETQFHKRGYKVASIEPTNLEKTKTLVTKKMQPTVDKLNEAEII